MILAAALGRGLGFFAGMAIAAAIGDSTWTQAPTEFILGVELGGGFIGATLGAVLVRVT